MRVQSVGCLAALIPLVVIALIYGCGSGGPQVQGTLNPADFVGNYSGRWVNNTFGSNNAADMVIAVDTVAKTSHITLKVHGNVLGGPEPPQEAYDGTYDATHFSIAGHSNTFGDITLNIDSAGHVTGTGLNPNANVSKITLEGDVKSQKMHATYDVTFTSGGHATGTLDFTKQ